MRTWVSVLIGEGGGGGWEGLLVGEALFFFFHLLLSCHALCRPAAGLGAAGAGCVFEAPACQA